MNKKSTLQIRLDAVLESRLIEACKTRRVSVSEVVRTLISNYCLDTPVSTGSVNGLAPEVRRFESLKELRASPNPEIGIGEMYCGAGGIAVAASIAKSKFRENTFGFKHIWATDYDPDSCQTYANNMQRRHESPLVICKDIRELDLHSLPLVDGFLYGFPCNDFSSVGESKGLNGQYGPLYKFGVQYIDRANPLFVFAENVSGLSSVNSGGAFDQIESELSAAGRFGYQLTSHLYKFEDYGVPQARHRYIIVGIRGDLGIRFEVPKPNGKIVTCKNAINSPPIPRESANNEYTRQSPQVVERLSHIKPGENAWTANLPPRLRLNVVGAQLSQIYKRLDPKKPSYTVTGSGGGGTHVYHWKENRALTNRERARLQTFPDDFEFFGSKESVRKQIGMAVPPKGAEIILEAILKTLTGKQYKSVKPSRVYKGRPNSKAEKSRA